MVYLLGWIFACLSLLFWAFVARSKLFLGGALIYFFVLFFFRCSGTDTSPIYETLFQGLREGTTSSLLQGMEPGFILLSKMLLSIVHSEIWAVRAVSLLYVFLLSVYLFRADRTEVLVLFLYFIPIFVYQYGMNGIRAGLAMAILLLAWQSLRRRNFRHAALLALVAFLFHYSSSLVTAFFLLWEVSFRNFRNWRSLTLVVFFLVLLLATLYFRGNYFEAKLLLYLEYSSPSGTSGLSRFMIVALALVFFLFSHPSWRAALRALLVLGGMDLVFQVLAFFSYAGLRFLDLLAFATPLLLIREWDKVDRSPNRLFWWGMVVLGMAGAAFVYRSFLSDYEGIMTGTPTPFLPYRTVWECQP